MSENIDTLIDFAIDEEKKAFKLYSETAEKTDNPELASILKNMAKMERGHAARLQAFKEGKIEYIGKSQATDLKIGDYLADVELSEDSSVPEVIIFAIKAEKNAHDLYLSLAESFEDKEEKILFQALAAEELRHKADLEKIYDEEYYTEN